MTVKPETMSTPTFLDAPLLNSLAALNWEKVLYAVIGVGAFLTRFWNVGARVMSHDESLHALYSWNLYAGKGYQHDPIMHGPFLFHFNALIYFLFGDNDFTARVSAAIFGVILVTLTYWLRPWLGRVGALAASFMLLISPGILYYSRYIRHDIFISVWTALMVVALFQYMRSRSPRWIFVGAAAVALSLSTKEVAFIHGFIGLTFILIALLWERLPLRYRSYVSAGLLAAIAGLVVVILVLNGTEPVLGADGEQTSSTSNVVELIWLAVGILGGWWLLSFNVDHVRRPLDAALKSLSLPEVGRVGLLGGGLGVLIAAGLGSAYLVIEAIAALVRPQSSLSRLLVKVWEVTPGLEILIGLVAFVIFASLLYVTRPGLQQRLERHWQKPAARIVWAAVGLGAVIFVLLYTTFFTNPAGLATGTYGAISYWLQQQDVQRGDQPWYYYFMLVPLYEFLPVLIGLTGGLIYLIKGAPSYADPRPGVVEAKPKGRRVTAEESGLEPGTYASDGGTFASFLIYWVWMAFVIYSWAGEKMPWLSVHMTLPLILLSGHVVQTVMARVDWRAAWNLDLVKFAVLLPILGAALLAALTVQPFQGQSLSELRQTMQFVAALIIALVVLVGMYRVGRRLSPGIPRRVGFAVGFILLSLLTMRFAWLFSYVNFDYVNEVMVYAHAAPDVKLILNEVDDISQRTVGDKQIKIAYGKGTEWPTEWYMREYPNRVFFGDSPSREALDAPVLLIDSSQEDKVRPFLGDRFDRFRYRLVWWPIEDYKNQTLGKLWRAYVSPRPPAQAWSEWRTPDTATPLEQLAAEKQTIRDNRRKMWRIFLYRDYEDYALNEWPYVHRIYLYVRKDIRNELWDYRSGPLTLADVPVDPYEGKRFELAAIKTWGNNGSGDGQFVNPRNVAVSPEGRVYVVDSGNNRIQAFDADGNFLTKWGSQGTGPGQFNEPWGIAVASGGQVYVADTWNHRIQVFDEAGNYLSEWGGALTDTQGNVNAAPGLFYGPRAIAFGAEGNVYVTDTGNKRIQEFSPAGTFLAAWGGGGLIPGHFEEPVGLTRDAQGNFYVADTWNHRVQKFDASFEPVAEWSVDGWEGESIFNKPYLTVDERGRLYVTAPDFFQVLVYAADGELLGTWGDYGFDLSAFARPQGLAVDDQGFLYVADADNNRLMKFDLSGLDLGEGP